MIATMIKPVLSVLFASLVVLPSASIAEENRSSKEERFRADFAQCSVEALSKEDLLKCGEGLSKCIDDGHSTAHFAFCGLIFEDLWQQKLSVEQDKLESVLMKHWPGDLTRLQASQTSWEEYARKDCEWTSNFPGKIRISPLFCTIDKTKERVANLFQARLLYESR